MRRTIISVFALFALALHAATACTADMEYAHYKATLTTSWTAERFPTDYPSNAHWSPPVAAVLADGEHMWQAGALASAGVQSVAETGQKSTLLSELEDASALHVYEPSAPAAAGSVEFDVWLRRNTTLSLVTMVAPSPDWFIGVDAVAACTGSEWEARVSVTDLAMWDAGTDSGETYKAADAPTSPHVNIALGAVPGGTAASWGSLELVLVETSDVDNSAATSSAPVLLLALLCALAALLV